MAKFRIDLPDGRSVVVEGADAQGAAEAADTWARSSPKGGAAAPAQKGPPPGSGFGERLKRSAASAYGGVMEGVGSAVSGAGEWFDANVQQRLTEMGNGGTMLMNGPVPNLLVTPENMREGYARAAEANPRIAGPYAEKVGGRIAAHGAAVAPTDRNVVEGVLHGAGEFGLPLASGPAAPLVFGAQGMHHAREEALQAGATPAKANRAGQLNAAIQAVIGAAPAGRLAEVAAAPLVKKVGGEVVGRMAANAAAHTAGNAAQGAALQTGSNLAAQATFDPERGLGEGVPEAALNMAVAGGVIHGALHATTAGKRAWAQHWAQKGVDPETVPPDALHEDDVVDLANDPHVQTVLQASGITADNPRYAGFYQRVASNLQARQAQAQAPQAAPQPFRPPMPEETPAAYAGERTDAAIDAQRQAEADAAIQQRELEYRSTLPPDDPAYIDPGHMPGAGLERVPEGREAPMRIAPDGAIFEPTLGAEVGQELRTPNKLPVVIEQPAQPMSEGEVSRAQAANEGGNINPAPVRDTMIAPEGRAPQTRDDLQDQRQAGQAFTLAERQRERVTPVARDTQTAGLPEGPRPAPVLLDEGFPVRIKARGKGGAVQVERYDPRSGMAEEGAEPYWTHEATLRSADYTPEPRRAQDFGARDNPPRMSPEEPRMATGPVTREDTQTFRATPERPGGDGGLPFPEQPEGPSPFRDQPRGERRQRAANEEELRQRYERAQQEQADAQREEQARGQRKASTNTPGGKDEDGRWNVDETGYVMSDKGGPIVFPDQKAAARWIISKGHAESPDQIFELANHPHRKGAFTVVERGRAETKAKPEPEQPQAEQPQAEQPHQEQQAEAAQLEAPRPPEPQRDTRSIPEVQRDAVAEAKAKTAEAKAKPAARDVATAMWDAADVSNEAHRVWLHANKGPAKKAARAKLDTAVKRSKAAKEAWEAAGSPDPPPETKARWAEENRASREEYAARAKEEPAPAAKAEAASPMRSEDRPDVHRPHLDAVVDEQMTRRADGDPVSKRAYQGGHAASAAARKALEPVYGKGNVETHTTFGLEHGADGTRWTLPDYETGFETPRPGRPEAEAPSRVGATPVEKPIGRGKIGKYWAAVVDGKVREDLGLWGDREAAERRGHEALAKAAPAERAPEPKVEPAPEVAPEKTYTSRGIYSLERRANEEADYHRGDPGLRGRDVRVVEQQGGWRVEVESRPEDVKPAPAKPGGVGSDIYAKAREAEKKRKAEAGAAEAEEFSSKAPGGETSAQAKTRISADLEKVITRAGELIKQGKGAQKLRFVMETASGRKTTYSMPAETPKWKASDKGPRNRWEGFKAQLMNGRAPFTTAADTARTGETVGSPLKHKKVDRFYSNPLDPELIADELIKPAGRLAKAVLESVDEAAHAALAKHYGVATFAEAGEKFLAHVAQAVRGALKDVPEAIRRIVDRAATVARRLMADESGAGPNPFDRKRPPPKGPTTSPLDHGEFASLMKSPEAKRAVPTLEKMRRSAAETADMLSDLKSGSSDFPTKLRRTYDYFNTTVGQGMRVIADHYEKTSADAALAVRELADHVATDPGSGRVVKETWERAVNGQLGQQLTRIENALGPHSTPESAAKIADVLAGRKRALPGTEEAKAAERVRHVLNDQWRYMRDAGLDVGFVPTDYFPRSIDMEKVEKDRGAFLADAAKFFEKHGVVHKGPADKATGLTPAEQAATDWHDRLLGISDDVSAHMAASQPLKGRVLPKAADVELAAYLNNDMHSVLVDYFRSTSRAAESVRRFGKNGEKLQALYNRMERGGVSAADMNLIKANFGSATGHLFGRSTDAIAPLTGLLQTVGVMRTLGHAVFSSMAEGLAVGAESANVKHGLTSLFDSWREMTALRQKDDAAAVAEYLGVVGETMNKFLMAARAGGEAGPRGARTLVTKFFRVQGLTQITEAQRIAALRIARLHIKQLTGEIATGHARAKSASYLLRDLGVSEADAPALHKWIGKAESDVSIKHLGDGSREAEVYRTAVRRFVDEAIQNPTAADRPLLANHPLARFAYSLQSFNYSYVKNVLVRSAKIAREGATGGYSAADRMRMIGGPVLAMLAVTGGQAGMSQVRDFLLNRESSSRRSPAEQFMTMASRANMFGNFDRVANGIFGAQRYNVSPAAAAAGPYAGGLIDDTVTIAKGADAALHHKDTNSPWRARRALYTGAVAPTLNFLSVLVPQGSTAVSLGTFAAQQFLTSQDTATAVADLAGTRPHPPKARP